MRIRNRLSAPSLPIRSWNRSRRTVQTLQTRNTRLELDSSALKASGLSPEPLQNALLFNDGHGWNCIVGERAANRRKKCSRES